MGERVNESVRVSLSDLIDHGIDWLNDYVSEQITGSRVALEDIGYEAHSVDDGDIILQVSGVIADLEQ